MEVEEGATRTAAPGTISMGRLLGQKKKKKKSHAKEVSTMVADAALGTAALPRAWTCLAPPLFSLLDLSTLHLGQVVKTEEWESRNLA